MGKGRGVLVEGRLTLNQWTTPEGDKRSRHEVMVENFTFLPGRGDGGGGRPSGGDRAGGGVESGYEPPSSNDHHVPF